MDAIAAFNKGDWGEALNILAVIKRDVERMDDEAWKKWALLTLDRARAETVERIAKDVGKEWRSGGFNGSREHMIEHIESSCDSACTYIQESQIILLTSQYDSAYLDEYGEMPSMDRGMPWSALAVAALRADVIAALRDQEDIDVDVDPPREGEIECSICDEWKPGKGEICNDCRDEPEEDEEDDEDDEAPPVVGPQSG